MKILWLCNHVFNNSNDTSTGTWLTALGEALAETNKLKLYNISQEKVDKIVRKDCGQIKQWVIPYERLSRDGLPSKNSIIEIKNVVEKIKPDLIHVWGTENYWGLLTARGILNGPYLLDMQGLKYACAKVFYGGLTSVERLSCIGPLEILRPGYSLYFEKKSFEHWGKYEKEMLVKHKFISTQSDWIRKLVLEVNSSCTLFKAGIILRREFYETRPWTLKEMKDGETLSIFTSSSSAVPYKGLHILIRAIAILKKKYPKIVLNIAGDHIRKGIRTRGYTLWLLRESRRLGLSKNIKWLGALDANDIIKQFHQSSAVVIPSFIESYSLALAEAMIVGIPVVVSFSGAMTELTKDNVTALLFRPGDVDECAVKIDKILNDQALAGYLSRNSRQEAMRRNKKTGIVENQINIYEKVLKTWQIARQNAC